MVSESFALARQIFGVERDLRSRRPCERALRAREQRVVSDSEPDEKKVGSEPLAAAEASD